MRLIILSLCFLVASFSISQDKQPVKFIQFSGVVVSADSLELVTHAKIINKKTLTGTETDERGYFKLLANPKDTILFTAFGFKPNSYIVPDTLKDEQYAVIHFMDPEVYVLPEVDIYPWPSKEQFAKAFLEMDPYDGLMRERARSFSQQEVNKTAMMLQPDSRHGYSMELQQYHTRLYEHRHLPVNNLLNPIAWYAFIESWRNGSLFKK